MGRKAPVLKAATAFPELGLGVASSTSRHYLSRPYKLRILRLFIKFHFIIAFVFLPAVREVPCMLIHLQKSP